MPFGFSRRNAVHQPHQKTRRPSLKRRRLFFDCLEDRRLLSISSSPDQSLMVLPNTASGVAITGGSSVAMDNKGDAVVIWADSQTTGSNGLPVSPWSLDFQLYKEQTTNDVRTLTNGAAGTVTSATLYDAAVAPQWLAEVSKVAMAPTTGNFTVAWSTQHADRYGHILYSTYVRLYGADGAPLTAPTLVGGSGDNLVTGVAMTDSGFDVLYASHKDSGGFINPSPTWSVQRFSATGATVGKPISVATAYDSSSHASIAADPNGNFIVGWSDEPSSGQNSVKAQRYSSGGNAQGGAVQINTSAFAFGVTLAMDANDDVVLAWQGNATADGYPNDGSDYDNSDLLVATILGGTNAISGPTVVVPTQAVSVDVVIAPGGGSYALTWVTYAMQAKEWSINADTYSLTGVAQEISPLSVFNTISQYNQQFASSGMDQSGDLLVVYSGFGAYPNGDGTSTVVTDGGVFGDFYLDPPSAATTTSLPTTSSASSTTSPSGSTTAATDALFAQYAYPEDDGKLG